jgi:hypothetical protein
MENWIDYFEFQNQYLSSWQSVALTLALYLATIYTIQKLQCRYQLKQVVIAHNAILSISSAILLLFIIVELLNQVYEYSFWDVICDESRMNARGRLVLYYYINYLFKYVELLDTVLLALRQKPMAFLHVYHHSATLVLCWTQLIAQSSVQWVPIVINLAVHVVMYYYYAIQACGKTVWWKKYLTVGQIIQFCVGISCSLVAVIPRIFHDFVSRDYSNCNGTYSATAFGFFILISYLALFIKLYNSEAYKSRTKSK